MQGAQPQDSGRREDYLNRNAAIPLSQSVPIQPNTNSFDSSARNQNKLFREFKPNHKFAGPSVSAAGRDVKLELDLTSANSDIILGSNLFRNQSSVVINV